MQALLFPNADFHEITHTALQKKCFVIIPPDGEMALKKLRER